MVAVTAHFPCPFCKRELRVTLPYTVAVISAAVVASLAIPICIGVQWPYVVLAAGFAFPILIIIVSIFARAVFHPKLEPYIPDSPSLFQKR
jgi:hypothetical protein